MNRLLWRNIAQEGRDFHFCRHSSFSLSSEPHCHDFAELFLLSRGKIGHCVNGETQELAEGSLALIRPDDVHFYRKNNSSPCELLNLAFPLKLVREILRFTRRLERLNGILNAATPPFLVLGVEEKTQMGKLLSSAGTALSINPAEGTAQLRGILAEILSCKFCAQDAIGRPAQEESSSWLADACRAMRQPQNLRKGLPALRKLACRGPEHICRSFKAQLGVTPTGFINEARLDFAAAQLASSDSKMHVVAREAGFANLSHFYHLFSARFGMPPAAYRKKLQRTAIPLSGQRADGKR
ncbi:MAG: hypothetical protein A2X49_02340 [Lentisphaerae bacterium GWF2_52_8]|nr:MAG: hypothetical protein A2X49_02340 [Lentisphaerae bacterium GWF2_52_8]